MSVNIKNIKTDNLTRRRSSSHRYSTVDCHEEHSTFISPESVDIFDTVVGMTHTLRYFNLTVS